MLENYIESITKLAKDEHDHEIMSTLTKLICDRAEMLEVNLEVFGTHIQQLAIASAITCIPDDKTTMTVQFHFKDIDETWQCQISKQLPKESTDGSLSTKPSSE